MVRGKTRGPVTLLLSLTLILAMVSTVAATTGTIKGTVTSDDGKPLAYANVILVGTNLGAMSLANGKFAIRGVPAGTYTVRAMMMGYKNVDKPDVAVSSGNITLGFTMERTIVARTDEILVIGEKPMIDVTGSKKETDVTDEQMKTMPVDNAIDAIALTTGIVRMGEELHVRGGRDNEVQVQYDGVTITNPLGGSSVDVGLLGTSGSTIVSGGMDAEYGNAQSAVINISTREGGRRFNGEFRYFTDDFGRQDKTYTNYDRVSLGLGGPTWWRSLRYFVSGEATFTDTENTTIEPRPEHKVTDWFKFRQRQFEQYNFQSKLTFNRNRMKMTGEAIMTSGRRDNYFNNWNIQGYVGKIYMFQSVALISPQGVVPEVWVFDNPRTRIDHGAWAEIQDDAQREAQLNIRKVVIEGFVLDETGVRSPVEYENFRIADLRDTSGNPVSVVWDEEIMDATGSTVLYRKPWTLFEGFQFGDSDFQPFLRGAPGDTALVAFNSATHTPEIRSDNLQLKLGFNHNITSKLLYSIKLSRLQLTTTGSVLDENGNQKDPAEFSSAGLPVTLPDGTFIESGLTNAQWYTDDGFPYFVTAYDYPFFSNQKTIQYLARGDLTSEQYKGHRIRTGFQIIYNDLNDDQRVNPAQGAFNAETGVYQQGLNVNIFHNFNAEGAFYAQDKWEYEGMVVNGGLRLEWFDVGNNTEIEINNADIDPVVDEFKWNLSPRLGVAFPITDRDKFFFHYGRFTQWPSHTVLFHTQEAVSALGTLGNPNLEPELSISYQAGISHQFTDDIAGNFVVFNRDIYGLVSSAEVTDDSTGIRSLRYTNRTYASSRGLEISLEKRLTRRLGFELYYTYSFADGVASNADFGRSAQGLTHLPTEEQSLDWDQRHTFNVTLRLQDRNKWGATAIYSYGSGLPWTPYDRFARLQDPTWENSQQLEPTHLLSVQGRKQFNIYGRGLTLFFEGRNLLDENVLLPGQTAPGAAPALLSAEMDAGSYLTETGQFGGAYLQDTNDDGLDEFNPVFDPTVWGQHRLWRLGLGVEF